MKRNKSQTKENGRQNWEKNTHPHQHTQKIDVHIKAKETSQMRRLSLLTIMVFVILSLKSLLYHLKTFLIAIRTPAMVGPRSYVWQSSGKLSRRKQKSYFFGASGRPWLFWGVRNGVEGIILFTLSEYMCLRARIAIELCNLFPRQNPRKKWWRFWSIS